MEPCRGIKNSIACGFSLYPRSRIDHPQKMEEIECWDLSCIPSLWHIMRDLNMARSLHNDRWVSIQVSIPKMMYPSHFQVSAVRYMSYSLVSIVYHYNSIRVVSTVITLSEMCVTTSALLYSVYIGSSAHTVFFVVGFMRIKSFWRNTCAPGVNEMHVIGR